MISMMKPTSRIGCCLGRLRAAKRLRDCRFRSGIHFSIFEFAIRVQYLRFSLEAYMALESGKLMHDHMQRRVESGVTPDYLRHCSQQNQSQNDSVQGHFSWQSVSPRLD